MISPMILDNDNISPIEVQIHFPPAESRANFAEGSLSSLVAE
jgi:hypothetical protein